MLRRRPGRSVAAAYSTGIPGSEPPRMPAVYSGQVNTGVSMRRAAASFLLVLFVAGGSSNWIDRLLHGRVVDFLNLGIGPVRTGVFNVADVAIMAGALLVILGSFRQHPSMAGDRTPPNGIP